MRNWWTLGVSMHQRFATILLSLLFTISANSWAQSLSATATGADSKIEVERVLNAQQEAWNRRDLEGFMTGYWNSPELTFFSGAKEQHGWQATLDRYRGMYASPGHEMGKLEFSGLRIERLGADAAFVRGTWQLTMSDGKTPHGLFTLVFRKFPEGWKIVHDHTSAE
jgi:ketosteroid isomerase-like protein